MIIRRLDPEDAVIGTKVVHLYKNIIVKTENMKNVPYFPFLSFHWILNYYGKMKGIDLCCCLGAGMRFLARNSPAASLMLGMLPSSSGSG